MRPPKGVRDGAGRPPCSPPRRSAEWCLRRTRGRCAGRWRTTQRAGGRVVPCSRPAPESTRASSSDRDLRSIAAPPPGGSVDARRRAGVVAGPARAASESCASSHPGASAPPCERLRRSRRHAGVLRTSIPSLHLERLRRPSAELLQHGLGFVRPSGASKPSVTRTTRLRNRRHVALEPAAGPRRRLRQARRLSRPGAQAPGTCTTRAALASVSACRTR